MEKRAILAVVLSIAVFYGYSLLFPPPQKTVETSQPAQQSVVPAAAVVPTAVPTATVPVTTAANIVTVDTDLYTAEFSTQGAALKRLVLKRYRESNSADARQVTLVTEQSADTYALLTPISGIPLDMTALYGVNTQRLTLVGGESGKLEFTVTVPGGATFRKIYTVTGNGYGIQLDCQLVNGSAATLAGAMQILVPYRLENKTVATRFEEQVAVAFAGEKRFSENVGKLQENLLDKNVAWAGFADKYFLSAVLGKGGDIASIRYQKKDASRLVGLLGSPAFTLAPGATYTAGFTLYFGPKELDLLKAQGSNLERAIDFGWFSALAMPLLHALKFFNRYTNNYGLAIIIITVILKVLFFPLTHKSYKSMKEMQKVQPELAKLKEKYKDDREAMNRAMMELYKTHKVNPLGGCLPMLVQIPVFFALYKALMYSIELRHAPFMLWITDLADKDPYYVTPIIMGATMFIQQKMTPSTMDPAQAKIMLMMPVVFTFMFLNFPSGLVLYWLVNNILTIAQQYYINKTV